MTPLKINTGRDGVLYLEIPSDGFNTAQINRICTQCVDVKVVHLGFTQGTPIVRLLTQKDNE